MIYDENMNTFFMTCYGPISSKLMTQIKKIHLLILDVDGVLSNGLIYVGNSDEEFKTFHIRDGYGIRCVLESGIEVAIITARKDKVVENRCKKLGITHLYQGRFDKVSAFQDLLLKLNITSENTAYIGDDLIDLPVMQEVGLSIAVANAHPLLFSKANYVTHMNGGYGAVREVCDLLLLAKKLAIS